MRRQPLKEFDELSFVLWFLRTASIVIGFLALAIAILK